jgi:phosphoglycolate phosphatase
VRYAAILFDLDGTLVDSHREISLALQQSLADIGVPLPFHEVGPMVDGRTLEHIWEVHVAHRLTDAQHDFSRFVQAYRAHYMADLGHATAVFPQVLDVLTQLRAHPAQPKLAVVSNKATASVPALLARFDLCPYFDLMIGAGGTPFAPKPAPDLLIHAADLLGVAPGQCVMVGDTAFDVQAGRAAGMDTIAFTHGMGSADDLTDADCVIPGFHALLPLLTSSRGGYHAQ